MRETTDLKLKNRGVLYPRVESRKDGRNATGSDHLTENRLVNHEPAETRYPEVAGTNEQCPLAFSLSVQAAVYLLSFSPSHLRTGRPTSGGCTLINGNLGERAASRPYTPTTERTAPNEKRAGSGARLRGRQQEAEGEK